MMLSLGKMSSLLGLAGLLYGTGALAAPAAPAPTVNIAAGTVIGRSTMVTSGTATASAAVNYLGIPFAAAPTGSLRFAPPETPTSWSEPVVATSLPPACLQQFIGGPVISKNIAAAFNNPGHTPPQESEDCLYLNVFAPPSASPANQKAVLFWIFGGNLEFGTGSLTFYNGSSFAAYQDVMVVTFNYRTNAFGFSGSPEIPAGKQNVGYLDQRMALQWVQDNIANFGGDPKRVTIFGESAGAYSVKQILANPPDPLPFQAAILQSAATTVGEGASYQQLVEHFSCTAASSQLDCLRKVDGLAIQKYINDYSLFFYPNADNATQTSDVRPNIRSKKFAHVPVMMGSNADEARIFGAVFGLDPGNATAIDQAIGAVFPKNSVLAKAVKTAYLALLTPSFENTAQIFTDAIFTCTASSLSAYLAQNGYPDTWRYYYKAVFPNLQFYYDVGAFHTSEIPQVFGTYDLLDEFGNATATQMQLSAYMQKTWADFAKNPIQGPGWPRLAGNSSTSQMGELGGSNPAGEATVPTSEADNQCTLFDVGIALGGL